MAKISASVGSAARRRRRGRSRPCSIACRRKAPRETAQDRGPAGSGRSPPSTGSKDGCGFMAGPDHRAQAQTWIALNRCHSNQPRKRPRRGDARAPAGRARQPASADGPEQLLRGQVRSRAARRMAALDGAQHFRGKPRSRLDPRRLPQATRWKGPLQRGAAAGTEHAPAQQLGPRAAHPERLCGSRSITRNRGSTSGTRP
jgi:hypothetical protein